ncbi:MAG: glycosyltransferase [Lentisphaeria bacterium]|nr:glycosyltransferase [Lentisphaeria bacterium]NQZ66457.1 glycosyltransferase [Lentisphaeria bacterium]
MKVALLHYWLTNMRGGENVVEQFCKIWPDLDIFTHAYNPEAMSEQINSHSITTNFINKLPGAKRNCQKYLPLMPRAIKSFNLSGYDCIISSESGPIKGIRKPPKAIHICYCHTPMRYLWDMYDDYYLNASFSQKVAMSMCKNYLRSYDLKSADSVDHFIANSEFVAKRIKRIYDRESTVIHPPVDVDFYSQLSPEYGDYYLFVGQLTHYKRPDLAIEACTKMNRPIRIVGNGPLLSTLRKNAGDNVQFLEKVSSDQLRKLYAGAKALIFPGVEDFGIVPLEAQAAGTPVIAYRDGGAVETVIEDKTGLFFDQQNVSALQSMIEEFELQEKRFSLASIQSHAREFSEEKFRTTITSTINKMCPVN